LVRCPPSFCVSRLKPYAHADKAMQELIVVYWAKEVERMNRQQSGRLGGKKRAANHRAHVENGKKGAAAKKARKP